MILPGISGSFVLLILGKYEYIMSAINQMNLPVLAVFGIGCAIGILAFSKCLHWLLGRYESQTMLVLVGFVTGSLVKVWPWSDKAALVRAELISRGMDSEAARQAVEAISDAGQSLTPLLGDPHTAGAIFFALLGITLVGVLEQLGKRKG